jgi:hypothetical protein
MMHYQDDDATGDDAAVAFCSQSAPKFAGRAWDLVIFDELNGQLWQVVGLAKPDADESDVLRALAKLAREARICAVADANADKDAVDFLLEAKRVPVVCDTPDCDAFAGKHVEVRAVVDYKTKAISKHATYLDVVETTAANDGQVGIACATVKAVKQIATMLRRRGVPVLAIHGKDSTTDKEHFTAVFSQISYVSHDQGVQGPNWPYYKAFVYSPTVTGGLSNNTCSLQLGVWSKYGPSVDQLSQQIKRCRKARHTIVWLLEDELLRARVPRLESTPSEPVVVTPELQVNSRAKSSLVAAWDFQAVLRWLGATARPYAQSADSDDSASDASPGAEAEAAVDDGADLTMDTVYSKPYEVNGQKLTYRMQMSPPPPIPTREDVVAAECAPDILAEELSHAHLAHDDVVRAVCARRFGGASLLDRLRISVALERQQRAANMLATLRAECERMKMGYSITVVVADKNTLERASAEVRRCFVVFMAELAMAEILWYFECMRQRSSLEEGMVVVHVANDHVACDKPPGEGDVRRAIRRRAAEAMRDVLGDGAASFESLARPAPDEHDHGLDDAGDTYLSHRIATYLAAFDDTPEGSDPPPYTHDSAVLLCKRFYSVMLLFGEANLDRVLLKVYGGLGRLLRAGAGTPDEFGFGLQKKELAEAERLLQEYHVLFRRDVQSKFRCVVEFCNDLAGAGGNFGSVRSLYTDAFVGGNDGKRRRLEQRVLVSTADDALRKAGVDKGLRAGPEDERRVLLFRSGAGVVSRTASRHRLPEWPNEARGERDEKVAKASDAVASLCSGPIGLRCSLKRKANQPLERFRELVNACLDPLGMRWEGPKDEHGYRTVKLHDMLRSPWVGDHVAEIPVRWSRFWKAVETEKQKGAVNKEVRRQRLEQVLALLRVPRAAGRRILHHGALSQPGDGDEDVGGDGATTE